MLNLSNQKCAWFILGLSSMPIWAEQIPDVQNTQTAQNPENPKLESTPITTLDDVVISTQRTQSARSDSAQSIDVIGGKQLGQTKATFIGQVLNTVPGVYMTNLGNDQHSMSIRQPLTTGAFYQYLEDGVPIRPVGIFNHNALYEINLEASQRVEVVKGSTSSLFGSNAVGGAVNFITQAPSDILSGNVLMRAGTQDYGRVDASISNSWQTTHGKVGAYVGGYVSKTGDGFRDYNGSDRYSVSSRVDWQLAAKHKLKAIASITALDIETPGSIFADQYFAGDFSSINTFTSRKVNAERLSFTLESDFSPTHRSEITAFLRHNRTDQVPTFFITENAARCAQAGLVAPCGRTTDNEFSSIGVAARQKFDFTKLNSQVILGLDAETSPNNQQEDNIQITKSGGKFISFTRTSRRRDYEVDLTNIAPYMQWQWQVRPDMQLTAGGRYDFIQYDYQNQLTPSASTGAPSETREFKRFSPKVSALWKVAPTSQLYANVSQGFTPPEISGLYGTLDTPNLKPSIYDNYELGWRWARPDQKLRFEAVVYQLNGRDEVVNFRPAVGASEPRNAGKTAHRGAEIGIWGKISPELEARASLTSATHEYRRFQVSPTIDFSGKKMAAAPSVLWNAELAYQPKAAKGLRVALEWQHVGNYWMDDANTVKYDGHHVFNLRTQYAPAKWAGWEVWAHVLNVANQKYSEVSTSSFTGVGARNANTQDQYTPAAPINLVIGIGKKF